jgi:signal transduction histidine kinase
MMFKGAYIRLTAWYVAILMALSLAFSVWVYREAMNEVRLGLSGPVVIQFQSRFGRTLPADITAAINKQFHEAHWRIVGNLVLLNSGVLVIGTGAAYVLSRRTLQPIEEALEAQNRFTADASHELRTPLAAMKTEIEVILRDPAVNKKELKELLQSNLEEIDRMSHLTQGLLTLARSGDGPKLVPVQARDVVEDVVQRMRSLADAKKISINTQLEQLTVTGEPAIMATIVCILLENAIKYSAANTKVSVMMARKDGQGLVSVIDNGPGIAPNDLPHVFERFYRADSSRSKEHVTGHGLGLSIAQKLVQGLGGTITAESTVGKGSAFTLRLPLAQ